MNQNLPAKPSLDHLKAQAKELLRDASQHHRFVPFFPRQATFKLSHAQLVIAREYGFASWNALRKAVVTGAAPADTDALISLLMSDDYRNALPALPSAPSHNLALACAIGDVKVLRQAKGFNPNQPLPPLDWAPLVYVSFSRLNRETAWRERLYECAAALLALGADPNGFYMHGDEFETCLYGATGANNCPNLATLLLENGANVDDVEALYHSCELPDDECLRVLLTHGGKLTTNFRRLLDFERPDMVETVLRLTENPQELVSIQHALRRGRSDELIQMLIDGGLDLNSPDNSGQTPYQYAATTGRVEVAKAIRAAGGDTSLRPLDRAILGTEMLTEEEKALLEQDPQPILATWCGLGKFDAVKWLIGRGASVNVADENGFTALHHAVIAGQPELVKLLLTHGSNPATKDKVHGGTPLDFACFHSTMNSEDSVCLEIAKVLIESGSPLPDKPWGSEAMIALLKSAG